MRAPTLWVLATAVGMTFVPPLQAQERGGKKKVRAQKERSAVLSVSEREIIVEFFHEHSYQVTALPPGIAKRLARGKPLPPGIAKKQIPARLRARLSLPTGVEISVVGDRIVLLDASGLVIDILEGVLEKHY